MTAGPSVAPSSLSPDSVPLPLRYLDCLLVLAFVPIGLVIAPPLGVAVGAAGWLVQRVIGAMIEAKAHDHPDFKTATMLQFGGGMLRPLALGITILAVGTAGEKEDGLAAALIVLVAFTVYLGLSFIFRPQRKTST